MKYNIILYLLFVSCFANICDAQIFKSKHGELIQDYYESYICDGDTVLILKYTKIEQSYACKANQDIESNDISKLHVFLAIVLYHYRLYDKYYGADYIIDDGLICEHASAVTIIRKYQKAECFDSPVGSVEIETSSDLLYWAKVNKNKIPNYNRIKKIARFLEKKKQKIYKILD